MENKVYALYFKNGSATWNIGSYAIKISCEKSWQRRSKELEEYSEEIWRYNDCYYLSFNRKALLQKAREIKAEWVKELQSALKQVEDIVIK